MVCEMTHLMIGNKMITINNNKCNSCGQCVKDCPTSYLEIKDKQVLCSGSHCIKCYHCIAICPKNAVSDDAADMSDIVEYNSKKFTINPETFLNAVRFRRSVRRFKDINIDKETINMILDAGRFSPTGGNVQNVSYVVVEKGIQRLTELSLKSLHNRTKTHLLDAQKSNASARRYAKLWQKEYTNFIENKSASNKLFFNAKTIIVIVSDSPANANLAAANMEMMANTLGLGACHIGFFLFASNNNTEIKEFLGLNENNKITACIALGYPDAEYKRTVPRNKSSVEWR